jgi:hypothetical protein
MTWILVAKVGLGHGGCAAEPTPSPDASAPRPDVTIDDAHAPADDAGPVRPWRSALFPPDWTPSRTDAEGRFLHDFSYAGYRAGEVPLGAEIVETIFDVVERGADPSGVRDATAAIQSAIDEASIAGGVVRFPEGLYRVEGRLEVRASRVVLRGEGASRSRLFFARVEGMGGLAHLVFRGRSDVGLEIPLAVDAEARDATVRVTDATGLAPGDEVELGFVISEDYVAAHGMTGTWTVFLGLWQTFARRTVLAVDGDVVTLDVPLREGHRVRDGASLRRVEGLLREVGLEDLGLANATSPDLAWTESQAHAVQLVHVKDAWVRGVASFPSPGAPAEGEGAGDHLASGGIRVTESRRVTIADTHLARAQNRGPGGNGYLFEISRSNEILTRDSTGVAGRHNFIQNWGFGTSGCVWLRVRSAEGRMIARRGGLAVAGESEFHHSLATANLVDASVLEDGWLGVNRGTSSSGAGHSATENVLWNVSGGGRIRSFQWGWGFVIGTSPELEVVTDGVPWEQLGTEPLDLVEGAGLGAGLEPPSLYEAQRALRRTP